MGIYILLIIVATLFNIIIQPDRTEKRKSLFLKIMFVFFVLIFALRSYHIGNDTNQYYFGFDIINNNPLTYSLNNLRFEKGFIILCKFISLFTNDSQWLLFGSGLIIVSSVLYFIYKNSNKTYISLLLFVFLNYFFMYMSAMRQAIAISIVLFGYEFFLKKDKKIGFILTVLLASQFHSSALVTIILLFLPKKAVYDNKKMLFAILISIFSYLFADNLFRIFTANNKYSFYLTSEYYNGNTLAGYINYLVCLVILLFSNVFGKNIKNDSNYNWYLYLVSLNLIFYALAAKISIFTRITTYFDIFNCVFLTYTLVNINNSYNRKVINVLFYILFAAYWITVCIFRPEWYGCVPYKFFW